MNKGLPYVSIIIPVYNDEAGVIACLDALSAQTYPSDYCEVIIVDNGSSEPLSLSCVCKFSCRVVRHLTPGAYAARNRGIKESRGEVLAFTDADCIPDASWVAEGVKQLQSATNGGKVIGGDVLFFKPEIQNGISLYQYLTGFQQVENITQRKFTATANLFCLRRDFLSVGGFDERLLSGGDREWCWRASVAGLVLEYCPTAIVHTKVRASFAGAIRQARRVAAGRRLLKQLEVTHLGHDKLSPHRKGIAAMSWILVNRQVGFVDKARVLFVAIAIKLTTLAELARLSLGSRPERR